MAQGCLALLLLLLLRCSLRRDTRCAPAEDPAAVSLKERLNEAEAALAAARNKMKLGYTDPKTGAWV
jgi:hypothetical protein